MLKKVLLRNIKAKKMLKARLSAGVGGFVGTCLRCLVGRLCLVIAPASAFPWGTFVVNMVGSFAIGLLFGLVERANLLSASVSLFLITGVCGGFTTFSTLSNDAFMQLQSRNWIHLLMYVGFSFVVGVTLVWLGRLLVHRGFGC